MLTIFKAERNYRLERGVHDDKAALFSSTRTSGFGKYLFKGKSTVAFVVQCKTSAL